MIYSESFETGLNGWVSTTTSGNAAWQLVSHPETVSISSALNPFVVTLADNGKHLPAADGVNLVWFGDTTGTFIGTPYPAQSAKNGGQSAVTQSGNLTSPPISLAGVAKAQLEFDSWWEIEGTAAAAYDLGLIQISTDGTTFSELGRVNPAFAVQQPPEAAYSSGGPAAAPVMRHYLYDLSAHAGKTIWIRFRFDSRDTNYNAFRGFAVDKVVVSGGDLLPAPLISSVSPPVATVNDLLTVNGEGFQQGALFALGGTSIPFHNLTQFGADQVMFKVPVLAPGTYTVKVTNPDGQTFSLPNAFTYSAAASPTVSAVTPATANVAFPKTVTITGSNFLAGATIHVGTEVASNVQIVSTSSAVATFPGLEAGAYNVKVTNPSGQSGTGYAVYTVADSSTLAVTVPTAATVWTAGSTGEVTWTSSGAASVDLALFKGGVFVTLLAAGVDAAAGSYTWTIPGDLPEGTDYQVKISTTLGTQSALSPAFILEAFTEVATSTVLTLSPSPSADGEPVIFAATVSPFTSEGSVQFTLDGVALGVAVPLVEGVAQTAPVSVSAGAHVVRAEYSGAGALLPSSGELSWTVTHRPVASGQQSSTDEDIAVEVVAIAHDADGDALTWTLVSGPTHGTLSGELPLVTYTPAANFSGADAFSFRVSDGTFESELATVTLSVAAVNDAPSAAAVSLETAEDSSAAILLSGTDVEGDALTFSVNPPAHGVLSGVPPNLLYTPFANFHGADSFTYQVGDGAATSLPATVSILVSAVNDAPVAHDQTGTTTEETAIGVQLTASDPDGDPLTFELVSAPQHGQLSGTPPTLSYEPHGDFHGQDAFTFRVTDGTASSQLATVSLTVQPVNDAPVAVAQSQTLPEDGELVITLSGTDVDGDALAFSVLEGPANGSLSGTAPNLTYRPAANYHGPDSFRFQVSDGEGASAEATVSLTVAPVNDPPELSVHPASTDEDTAVPLTLAATDVDGDALTWALMDGPLYGTLEGTLPTVSYSPQAHFWGADRIRVRVSDGTAWSATVELPITVRPVNDPPTAHPQSVTVEEDGEVAITLGGGDLEGAVLQFSVISGPAHGRLEGSPPELRYIPDADFHGADSFAFTVHDGALESPGAEVSLQVTAVNDAPVAAAQTVTLDEDASGAITLAASDVDGDLLQYELVAPPSHGALSGTLPDVTYTPAADFHGEDQFTFRARDAVLSSEITGVSLIIRPVNDAPVTTDREVATDEDLPLPIVLEGADVEGQPLSYEVVSQPAHGTLTGVAPELVYTPAADFHGRDSFTFKVHDGHADSLVHTVSVVVASLNDPPGASSLSVTTEEDQRVAFTLVGSDVDGDALSFSLVTAPQFGTLTGTPPELQYTPRANFTGEDSFTFTTADGALSSQPATVQIAVGAVNDAPLAWAETLEVMEDTRTELLLRAEDPDGDALSYAIISGPAHGALSGTAPNLAYTPHPDYFGNDRFSFRVSDGAADSEVVVVSFEIVSVDDAPVAAPQTLNVSEDLASEVLLHGADVEGAPLSYEVVSPPAHGVLTGAAPHLVYRPDPDYEGADSFTFEVIANGVRSAPAVVTIIVDPSEDRLGGGGVGCSSTGRGAAAPLLLVLLGLLVRRGRALATLLGLAGVMLTVPLGARAQQLPRMDAEALRLNPGAADGLVASGGQLLETGRYRVSLTAHHERDPLVFLRDGERMGALVADRSTAHLALAWAPWSWLELSAQVPLVLMQRGDDLSEFGMAAPAGFSAGTSTVQGRTALWREAKGDPLDLSAGLGLLLPLGHHASMASEQGLGLLPAISAGRRVTPWLRAGAELGVALRPSAYFDGRTLERSAVELAGVLYTLGDGLRGELSWRGALLASGAVQSELLAGGRYPIGRWLELYAVGGVGLGGAPGTPAFRALAGVAFSSSAAPRGAVASGPQSPPLPPPAEVRVEVEVAPAVPCPTEPGSRATAACPDVPLDEAALSTRAAPLAARLAAVRMFEPRKTTLLPAAKAVLDDYAALLLAHRELTLQAEGYTDDSGDRAYNVGLSRARAETVRQYLLLRGVRPDRVEAFGFGPERPTASNATVEGREANRRVELRLQLSQRAPVARR